MIEEQKPRKTTSKDKKILTAIGAGALTIMLGAGRCRFMGC